MTLTVALVDDQQLVRAGFAMVVDSQPDMTVAWQAADGAEALRLAAEQPVDVVLMDVQMPRLDGIAATRAITSGEVPGAAATRVVVLTTFDTEQHVIAALAAGASGFLLKDADPEQLLAALRAVADGDSVLSARSTRRLLDHVRDDLAAGSGAGRDATGGGVTDRAATDRDGAGRTATDPAATDPAATAGNPPEHAAATPPDPEAAAALEQLTARELEFLGQMALGLTNAELGAHFVVSEATVKTHVGRILAKTGSRDRVQAVLTAFRAGLVTPGDLAG